MVCNIQYLTYTDATDNRATIDHIYTNLPESEVNVHILETLGYFTDHKAISAFRGGWPRAELHYGSILQYASVYTISHAVRSSGEATEDPLKSEFLAFFQCKC